MIKSCLKTIFVFGLILIVGFSDFYAASIFDHIGGALVRSTHLLSSSLSHSSCLSTKRLLSSANYPRRDGGSSHGKGYGKRYREGKVGCTKRP